MTNFGPQKFFMNRLVLDDKILNITCIFVFIAAIIFIPKIIDSNLCEDAVHIKLLFEFVDSLKDLVSTGFLFAFI